MDKLKVGIMFGGSSEEHAVSIKSAQEVARSLDLQKYEPFYIGITKVLGSYATVPAHTGRTRAAFRLCYHPTGASTDYSFLNMDNTK